jgi:hypothetical protein
MSFRVVRLVALGLGLLAAGGGCSEPSNDDGATLGEGPSPMGPSNTPTGGANEDWRQLYVEHVCRIIIDCPVPNDDLLVPRAFFQTMGGDPYENCHYYYYDGESSRLIEALDRQLARAEAGALELNSDVLEELVGCSAPLRSFSQFPTPKTPEGAPCQLHEECIDGYCNTATCPGTCVRRAELGGQCYSGSQCLSGVCGEEGCAAEPTAVSNILDGMPCSTLPTDSRYCAQGLWCNEAGVCQRPVAALAPCADDDDVCVDGHICTRSADGLSTCVRLVVLPEGARCEDFLEAMAEGELQLCNYIRLESCVEGVCTRFSTGEAGDPCIENESRSTCNEGNYCDWDSDVCVADTQVGQACSSSQECNCQNGVCSELYCSASLD